MQRALLALGAGATLVTFVFLLGEFSTGNAPAGATPKFALQLAPFTVWALSPYWALFMLPRVASPTRARDIVLLVASALVATLAVVVYLPTFVFSSVDWPKTGAVLILMFIPAYQWAFAAVAWVLSLLLPGPRS